MVSEALEQRRKFGKMFTVDDMPPEFLDALVIVHSAPRENEMRLTTELAAVMAAEHEKLVLANRQLGAAAARETKLRKQLASLAQTTGAGTTFE
jgi:hypothetical protein